MKNIGIILLFSLLFNIVKAQTNMINNGNFEGTAFAQSVCDNNPSDTPGQSCNASVGYCTGTAKQEDLEAYWLERGAPWTCPDKKGLIGALSADMNCDGNNHYAKGTGKETICIELNTEMKAGHYYIIEYKVRNGNFNPGQMGFAFTNVRPKQRSNGNITIDPSEVLVYVPQTNSNTFESIVSDRFMARSDASWLTFYNEVGWGLDDVNLYETTAPTIIELPCCPYDLTIANKTFTSNDEIKANHDIMVDGPSVVIANNSNVLFSAGHKVEISAGIDINPGSGKTIIENQICTGNENYTPSADFIPNFFTPNGDNQNDNFCLRVTDTQTYTFAVFTPSGSLVKSTILQPVQSNTICLWDGTCGSNTPGCDDGDNLPTGTYFFTLTLSWCGNNVSFEGNIFLNRGSNKLAQSDSIANVNTELNNEIIQYQKEKSQDKSNIKYGSIQIIPNPNNGLFTIITDNQKVSIAVRNLLGEVIIQTMSSSNMNEINLYNYAKGIYFISIKGEGINETKKVIIE